MIVVVVVGRAGKVMGWDHGPGNSTISSLSVNTPSTFAKTSRAKLSLVVALLII